MGQGEDLGASFDVIPLDECNDIPLVDDELKAKAKEYHEQLVELAVEQDEEVLMQYLEGEMPDAETIKKLIRKGTLNLEMVPVLTGTAFKNKGVQPLLDAVIDYMPSPLEVEAITGVTDDGEETFRASSDKEPFSALAFKVANDPFVGTLTFTRIYSGVLETGTSVWNSVKGRNERIGRMLQMHANDRTEIKTAVAGDIVALVGLKDTTTGATVCAPSVSYREAITKTAEIDYTHKKQSGGSGQYARVKLTFEPKEFNDEEGSTDFEFVSTVKGGSVPKEFIPSVQKGIESILGAGVVAGFPVLGMKATLSDGNFHPVDSSTMAFEIAGRAAAREGLRMAKARLMEPLMQVDVSTPEEYMGDVLGDINARRGLVGDLGERGNVKTIAVLVPLANMFQYVSSLRSMSKGRAYYSMKLANYDFVPPNIETELKAGFSGETEE